MDNLLCEESWPASPLTPEPLPNFRHRSHDNDVVKMYPEIDAATMEEAIAMDLEKELCFNNHGDKFVEFFVSKKLTDYRFHAFQWLIQTRSRLNLSYETVFSAANCFDRFVYMTCCDEWTNWMVELVAVTSLSIASKFNEVTTPLLEELEMEGLTHMFHVNTVAQMELIILKALEWRVNAVTSYTFSQTLVSKIDCIHGRPLGVFGCTYPCASSNTFLDPSHPTIGLSDPFRQTIGLSHPTRPTIGLSDPSGRSDPSDDRSGRSDPRIGGEWMLPEASHPFFAPLRKVTSVPCILSKGHICSLHPLDDATVRWYPLDLTLFGRDTSSPVSYDSPPARVSADRTTQLDCIHGRPLGVFGCTYPCASSNTFLDPSHPTIGLSDPFRQTIGLSHPTRPTIGLSDPSGRSDPSDDRSGRSDPRIGGEWMLPEASHPFFAPLRKVTSVPCILSKGHICSLHPLDDATVRWYPLDLTLFGRDTSSPVSYDSPPARVSADRTTQLDLKMLQYPPSVVATAAIWILMEDKVCRESIMNLFEQNHKEKIVKCVDGMKNRDIDHQSSRRRYSEGRNILSLLQRGDVMNMNGDYNVEELSKIFQIFRYEKKKRDRGNHQDNIRPAKRKTIEMSNYI
ncbi:Cyclin N-terminal [Arabidopsis thaliana x Arabidopsis arenosa]|uniref:Cyclin N-terminal n=1 Tax=Arabidopsis thaliana x Arabidopsis arenosa TaxID=1240361 RepID=A0A8T2CRY1_9BRAS|nr:Cyclin N-terminal [Arabidopsis thaliana x Arabidopsis arenosa]